MSNFNLTFVPNKTFEVVEFHERTQSSANSTESTVAVKSGGYGSVRGVMFSAPGYSTTTVTFTINTVSFSADDINNIKGLIKSMVSASDYKKIEEHTKTSASGSWSFFTGPKAEASASYTKDVMEGYGLSEENQKLLITKLFELLPKPSTYTYTSVITNPTGEQVSGQMMLYNFTGVITMNNEQKQVTMVGNPVALGPDGSPMPSTTSFG